jgi:hypothetical protein
MSGHPYRRSALRALTLFILILGIFVERAT